MPRLLAGLIAVAAWAGLAIRIIVSYNGDVIATLWAVARYFTILTGLLAALVMTAGVIGRRISPFVLTGTTLASILVGVVYVILLRHELTGARYVSNALLHYVVPTGMAAYWLAFGQKRGLSWRHPFAWMLYPFAYFVYALGRGAIDGRYPYPFMDLNQISLLAAIRNGIAIAALFLLAGFALVWVDSRRPLGSRGSSR
ncbi:MAG TPA: Pr6Pr family membrane protein [Sphingomicrobium sp.]